MLHLRPSDISFTHHQVNNHFKKRTAHSGYSIGLTLDDLCVGRCKVSDIPTIRVMWEDGKWWTADNRRLWVFRHYERLGGCSTIPVTRTYWMDPRKKSTMNGGRSVEVRYNSPGGEWWRQQDGSLSAANTTSIPTATEDGLANLSLRDNHNLEDGRPERRVKSISPSTSAGNALFDVLDRLAMLGHRARPVGQARDDQSDVTAKQARVLPLQPTSGCARLIRPGINRILPAVSRRPSLSFLHPEKVQFTKRQISVSMEGRFPSVPSSVYKLWMNLVDGGVIPEYIPPIDVYHIGRKYWVTSGNRRLWAFKQATNALPGLLIQAQVFMGDEREFLRKVNENNQSNLSVEDVLAHGDDVDIVDSLAGT